MIVGTKHVRCLALSSILLLGENASTDFLAEATSIKMDFLPTAFARVDPILQDSCVSDHVHTFYGPQSGIDPRRFDRNDPLELHSRLLGTSVRENTGNVQENKSLYWHPTVYKYHRDTDTYTRDAMAQTSAYYVWETGQATAFPNGFQMIGGLDPELSEANAECVNPSPCDDDNDDCYTENDFFPSTRCDELEVSMRMPGCWDGLRLNSPPYHTDHVAYADANEPDANCPDSHPIKLPIIHLFFRISPYDGGWHTFSDGTAVFHADYVSGWDQDFLQDVLDHCRNESFAANPNAFCEDFLTFKDAPKCTDETTCDFADPELLRKIRAFQPDANDLDVAGTIVDEETRVVVGGLPRGPCNGELVGGPENTSNLFVPPDESDEEEWSSDDEEERSSDDEEEWSSDDEEWSSGSESNRHYKLTTTLLVLAGTLSFWSP